MSVAAHDPAPASTGGDTGRGRPEVTTPGVRPRAGRVCAAPRLARRMDRRPAPRLRSLQAVRAVPVARAEPEPAPEVTSTAWDAAMEAARSQVGPVALRVLSAVAEVLDGRRPVGHLEGVCPAGILPVVRAAARRPAVRGTRVRGLRMCPLVTTGAAPALAVEVAGALCPPAGRGTAGRTRAVAARFERHDDAWRLTELVVG
ncbi:hypothetical protein GCM10023201_39470 [Actinomycetospora corticicola]|uniref:Uncharacterized protein n=1 Tax=Actinomycetospora corticicola TaxID=663602 RepID=A0A7Y9J682_9PSEU|nr:Rv3235 family protein [Actinomycetospora corticicola]NYD36968.1 hypothetical protein [Actinomycetospora corticicola]